jgi:DNA modification methylase
MWEAIERVIKPNGAIVLFGSQPFTSALVMSNPGWFRYEWIWEKPQGTYPQGAKIRPLRSHENVLIFYGRLPVYQPQMGAGRRYQGFETKTGKTLGDSYSGKKVSRHSPNSGKRYPKTVVKMAQERGGLHPNQKPVALLAYLIRTYTNKGETVLDFCMGSGSTGAACIEEGRDFIGIEKDAEYFEVARRRLEHEQTKPRTMRMEMI